MADTPVDRSNHVGSGGGSPKADLAAILLVGGRAKRLAGAAKSELVVGGRTMLERMLTACADAAPRVVVGLRPTTAGPLPEGVVSVLEEPPGSGPATSVAAGLKAVPAGCERVAILPGDLPFLSSEALRLLLHRSESAGSNAGAVYCDDTGRRQWLCGIWPTEAVRENATKARPGDAARILFTDIKVSEVSWEQTGPPPWFDCDTPEDLEQARKWVSRMTPTAD